jgi:hypothetical protein
MTTFGRHGKREVSQLLSVCVRNRDFRPGFATCQLSEEIGHRVFGGASPAARNRDDVQSNHSTQINEKGKEYADI